MRHVRPRFPICIWLLAAAIVLLLAFFFSCSNRPRSNPLDPENPQTGGVPPAPDVISSLDTVTVRWEPFSFIDLTAVLVHRKLLGETQFSLVAELSPEKTEFRETGAAFRRDRWYRISLQAQDYQTPLSPAAHIRPGPTFVWATNSGQGTVAKFTHDGEHLVFQKGFFLQPTQIVVDSRNHFLWVADFWARQVVRLSSQGNATGVEVAIPNVMDMAVDSTDGSLFVLSREPGELRRVAPDGKILFLLQGLGNPRRMDYDPVSQSVLILDAGTQQIWRVSRTGEILERIPAPASARDLAVDGARNLLWLADSSRLLRVPNLDFTQQQVFPDFQLIRELAVDPRNGDCWGVDWNIFKGGSSVFKFNAAGRLVFRKTGFTDLQGVAINEFNGNGFIIEAAAGRLIQISPTGEEISRIRIEGNITDVAVERYR